MPYPDNSISTCTEVPVAMLNTFETGDLEWKQST
jgi:hypothetical protein